MKRDPSKSLKDWGQYQRLVMLVSWLGGCVIWMVAIFQEDNVADPAVYGSFIAGPSAEIWAIPLAVGAFVHLVAQTVNGDPRLRPWITPALRMISAAVVFAVMAAFTFGAVYAPIKLFTIVQFVQSSLWAALSAWFIVLGWQDLRAGWETRHESR